MFSGKSSDVNAEVSKLKSKLTDRLHKKSVFVLTYYLCGVVGHIRPNCSLLRQKSKSETRFAVRNIDVPKFVHDCHFCGVVGHIRPNCSLLRQKPKSETRFVVRNTDVLNLLLSVTFMVLLVTFILTVIN